jgi:branched-chain amino acid transport system substrate-binding protein
MAVVLATVLIALAGCGDDDSESTAGGGGGGGSGPITIGAAIAETGILQPYDGPAWTAFKMAVADANADGGVNGRKIKLITGDTKSEIPNGATVAKSLLDKGADIMVVTCDFDFGSPAAQVAQAAGKVSMSLCAQSPKFGAQGVGDKAYTVSESVLTEGVVVASFARDEKDLKNAFLLVDDTLQYDRGLCDGFEKGFTEQGGEIAGEAHWKGGNASIAGEITKIKSSGADSVVLCSFPPAGASALRQLRSAGIDLPILSGGGMDGTYWIKAVPDLSDFYITTQVSVFGNDPNPDVNDFVKRFERETGAAPATAYAAVGFSAAQALLDALAGTDGDPSGDALMEQLNAFDDQELLVGPTTFTPEIHIPVDRPMAVLEYRKGKPDHVTTQEPGVEVGLAL